MEPLRRAFRGYDAAQTDSLLAELDAKRAAMQRELDDLRSENGRLHAMTDDLRSQLGIRQSDEAAIKNALIGAHRQSEEVLEQARKDADVLLQVAREAGARMQEDLRGRISDLHWQIERLSLQRSRFQAEFRELLEGHLAQIAVPSEFPESATDPLPQVELPDASSRAPAEAETAT